MIRGFSRRHSTQLARRLPLLLAFALASSATLAAAPARAADARLVVSFEDPAGDATGPGSYTPPRDPAFAEGDFDLRRFAVYDEGGSVRLEVTLGAPPGRAGPKDGVPGDLGNGITFQNVDVYVDSDPAPGSGSSACIPGRRIAFADGRTWETAVVLTPQPRAARAAVAAALGGAAGRVLFPGPVEVRDHTLVARVPAAALGGTPTAEWGWSVQVSGPRWGRDRAPGPPDAFTMPVLAAAGPRAFGGAPPGEVHPRVVDVLLPPGVDQKAVLGSYHRATGAFARAPFVFAPAEPAAARAPDATLARPPSLSPRLSSVLAAAPAGGAAPPPPAAAPRPPASAPEGEKGPLLTVARISEDVVTLAGPNIGLAPQQTGRLLGRDGGTVGHVVIEKVLENGAVARVVSGRENVRWGGRVRFDVAR